MTLAAGDSAPLRSVDSHFAFGDNWASFVDVVDDAAIEAAKASLTRLLPPDEITGASFLDIGCGSGLSMLAASALGAGQVEGIDIDPMSVEATRALFAKAGRPCRARVDSVFDLEPSPTGFDIVHSWGVLHHTGDMWAAIDRAAALVAPGGLLALALYRKTALCGAWTVEKKIYTGASPATQGMIAAAYKGLFGLGLLVSGRWPPRYFQDYRTHRGMNWRHDVHDWLGGYPYESVTPQALGAFLRPRGFELRRQFVKPGGLGLFGSACDEFVWRRASGPS
jgi:SAM-dependent methyltransferase